MFEATAHSITELAASVAAPLSRLGLEATASFLMISAIRMLSS